MYLVELRPGKEELYRTMDELAAAIRKGDVDTHSRIYHRATSKWISVTLHPQYKAIVSERPAAPPLPPLERTNWTFFNDAAESLAGAQDASPDEQATDADDKSGQTDPNHPWRRPLALSITGGLLILGLQLAASGPKPPWAARQAKAEPSEVALPASMPASPPAEEPAPPASRVEATSPAPMPSPTISLVNSGSSWTELNRGYAATVSAPAEAPPIHQAPELPAAPTIRTKGLLKAVAASTPPTTSTASARGTPVAPATTPAASATATVRSLVARWAAAHDSALARLQSGVRVARLNQLFASSRLTPGDGVTETRMSLAGVANFVRIYRQQQAAIERQYQDSFTATAKSKGWSPADVRQWYAKPSRTDSPTAATLTSTLIEGIDSLLGVLDAQAGTYAVTKNTIRFEDPTAAREYMALRERIVVTVDSARVTGVADRPGPMNYLLQAIGATRLPIAS
jgi:hypothetical protein